MDTHNVNLNIHYSAPAEIWEKLQNIYRDLSVILPCCGEKCSLDDLKYHFPCGFAMAEITILNPKGDISEELMKQIEELVGTAVQAVHAHL